MLTAFVALALASAPVFEWAFLDAQFETDLQMRCKMEAVGCVDWEARFCASKNSCLWRIRDVNCPLNDGEIETFAVVVDDMCIMYNV